MQIENCRPAINQLEMSESKKKCRLILFADIEMGSRIVEKMAKKNAELQEVRETRKKLEDKEQAIKSAIEKLQNQKIEFIFEQVKKEIKSENLNVTSSAVTPLLEVLRKNHQTVEIESASVDNTFAKTNKEADSKKINSEEILASRANSVTAVIQK